MLLLRNVFLAIITLQHKVFYNLINLRSRSRRRALYPLFFCSYTECSLNLTSFLFYNLKFTTQLFTTWRPHKTQRESDTRLVFGGKSGKREGKKTRLYGKYSRHKRRKWKTGDCNRFRVHKLGRITVQHHVFEP